MTIRYVKLTSEDRESAKRLFAMMANVFAEGGEALAETYITRLLADDSFWAFAAFDDDEPVGGVTAHVLPMTHSESSELFIYDVAVRTDYQRKGIGRNLIAMLRTHASEMGIHIVFVPADNEDEHALEFYGALGADAASVTFFTFPALASERLPGQTSSRRR